jgi:hypothetical protein
VAFGRGAGALARVYAGPGGKLLYELRMP